jgi:hypothetical protein
VLHPAANENASRTFPLRNTELSGACSQAAPDRLPAILSFEELKQLSEPNSLTGSLAEKAERILTTPFIRYRSRVDALPVAPAFIIRSGIRYTQVL